MWLWLEILFCSLFTPGWPSLRLGKRYVVDVSPKQSKQMETGDGDGDDDCMGNYDYIDDCTFFINIYSRM